MNIAISRPTLSRNTFKQKNQFKMIQPVIYVKAFDNTVKVIKLESVIIESS